MDFSSFIGVELVVYHWAVETVKCCVIAPVVLFFYFTITIHFNSSSLHLYCHTATPGKRLPANNGLIITLDQTAVIQMAIFTQKQINTIYDTI